MSVADPALLEIKNTILRDPRIILEDRAVIQALIEANGAQGRNHRDVIAAAYENLAGTNQIHRAALSILEPTTFNGFIEAYATELPGILSIETVTLCLEGKDTRAGAPLGPVGDLNQSVIGLPLNGAATYFGTNFAATGQRVMLREAPRTSTIIYGREDIGSEALIRLDFGPLTCLPSLVRFLRNQCAAGWRERDRGRRPFSSMVDPFDKPARCLAPYN